jgi:Phage derived protein Gp49-like (DUF891).
MTEPRWPVVYYRAPDRTEPVNAFVDGLEPKIQVVLDNQIERIGIFGPHLPFPHSSQVEGELRELRCHYGNTLYRILYRRSDNLFVLLQSSRSARAASTWPTSRSRTNGGPTSSAAWTKRRVAPRGPPVMTHPSA